VKPESALLLVGSPKKGTSTSESLGTHLLDRLARHAIPARIVRLHRVLSSAEAWEDVLAAIETTDLVILAAPLYVDSLPSHVIAALERITARRQGAEDRPSDDAHASAGDVGEARFAFSRILNRPRFVCIVNCGFPEARHNETAIRICRQFAREAGFDWAGGLALGGGEMIAGKPLVKMGGMVRRVVAALDLAAEALATGDAVPDQAVTLMAKPLISPRLFVLAGAFVWRMGARRYGAQRRLKARPYASQKA
jgi:hypothetical protein